MVGYQAEGGQSNRFGKEEVSMPWIIGVDEAGYGPNLGPLVMSAVAVRVPGSPSADLWHLLRAAVRRATDDEDDRLLVADSKLAYANRRGLDRLEAAALAFLCSPGKGLIADLGQYVERVCPVSLADLCGEPWYQGKGALPAAAAAEAVRRIAERLATAASKRGLQWGPIQSVVVCPGRFNQWLDRWDTKGAVLGQALAELVAALRLPDDPEPVWYFIDKHGGRNHYTALLQEAIPDGMVVAREEGMDRSVYGVLGLGKEVSFTFAPRADAEHFAVALASMASKYLRELLMQEFNAFWLARVPGLRPTAGYPTDAHRFFRDIGPAAQELGIPEAALWRRR
jgi:hypothetical protein